MISEIIENIVTSLQIDEDTLAFYSGTAKVTNKTLNNENGYYVFLERPVKFETIKKTVGTFDLDNKLVIAFLKHSNIDESYDAKNVKIAKTFEFFKLFVSEARKQGYKIDNVTGTEVIDFSWFDNNSCGYLFEFTFNEKNKFSDCYD